MSALIRDADKVKSFLKELPTGQLITTKACRIQIPERFAQKNLAQIGIQTYICGIYALIIDDYYAVSITNAMMRIEPEKVLIEEINGVNYYEFYFTENSIVFSTVDLVKQDTLVYDVLDELLFNGKIPWYIRYDDLGKLFDSAKKHANSNVAQNFEVIELIASMLSRQPKDRSQYYRYMLKSQEDVLVNPPSYVPMKSVFYSASNTLNKLAGSYFNDGVVAALVSPSSETQKIETLLRA